MKVIPLVNGAPKSQIPFEAIAVYCDGINYYVYFAGDTIPPEHQPQTPQPQPEPDWLNFRLAIFQNLAYQTVTLAALPIIVSRFEAAVMASPPHLPMMALLWDQLLATVIESLRPTSEDYESWNAAAADSNIPVRWLNSGKLTFESA